jgi:hypothetical protein
MSEDEKVNLRQMLRHERLLTEKEVRMVKGVFIFLNIFKFPHDDLSLMSPQPRFYHHHHQVKLFEYNVGIMQVLRTIINNSLDNSFTHVFVCMLQEVGMHIKHHM